MKKKLVLALALASAGLHATAATVWTDWTTAVLGDPGSANGTLDGSAVAYTGQVLSFTVIDGGFTSWLPDATYIGGTVTTSPVSVGDMIAINGCCDITNTITFAKPVTNPLLAIWSLGAPNLAASITFSAAPTFEVGGPNTSFGGEALMVADHTVSGKEANGVVQFNGTFTSITFKGTSENFYAFTVGENVPAVPEPESWAMALAGLAGLGLLKRRQH